MFDKVVLAHAALAASTPVPQNHYGPAYYAQYVVGGIVILAVLFFLVRFVRNRANRRSGGGSY